jgi:hypothetical protein
MSSKPQIPVEVILFGESLDSLALLAPTQRQSGQLIGKPQIKWQAAP